MSSKNIAKTESNIAHCYNANKRKQSRHHCPYITLCISYKQLNNHRMALLALFKGWDILEADSDISEHITSTQAVILTSIQVTKTTPAAIMYMTWFSLSINNNTQHRRSTHAITGAHISRQQ